MQLDGIPLGAVERARLVQHAVADAQLADVVQQRAALEPAAALGIDSPSASAIMSVYSATRALWPLVYGLFASTTWPKAVAMSSR